MHQLIPTLDHATHTYRLGRVVVPGVTSVIDRILKQTWRIDREVLANRAEIGQLVHEATELDVEGELDDDTIDKEILGYVRAFRRFREEMKPTFHSTEELVYHPAYNYAGTLDHVMELNGAVGVVDKKSGMEMDANEVQIAAYWEAKMAGSMKYINGKLLTRGWVLYLRENGTYKLHPVKERGRLFQIFVSALNCYNFIERGK